MLSGVCLYVHIFMYIFFKHHSYQESASRIIRIENVFYVFE